MAIFGLFGFLVLLECRAAYGSFEIVGGDPISIENVPYFAIYKVKHVDRGCGASIVTNQFVISAAHCYLSFDGNPTEVIVGTDKIYEGEHHEIMASYPHPSFIMNNLLFHHVDCDVVLLKLSKKLIFNDRVQPIALAEPNMVIEDNAVFETMGFGRTNPYDPNSFSNILLAVDVPYVTDRICAKTYGKELTKHMICAGEEGKDSCQNDSGGPLVYKDKLIGIVSFGRSCAEKDTPGVYAKVSSLRDFIDKIIKENQ
ncbi:vitellin-degrading protease-like [Colias croceus]|uniref:vitellin-degrading protease-like n=1 Tax=Colias crocea TaxID=72248 RepID=UPI001E2812C7|nr:vitellin-degrading protease-like [Colias croceus]